MNAVIDYYCYLLLLPSQVRRQNCRNVDNRRTGMYFIVPSSAVLQLRTVHHRLILVVVVIVVVVAIIIIHSIIAIDAALNHTTSNGEGPPPRLKVQV